MPSTHKKVQTWHPSSPTGGGEEQVLGWRQAGPEGLLADHPNPSKEFQVEGETLSQSEHGRYPCQLPASTHTYKYLCSIQTHTCRHIHTREHTLYTHTHIHMCTYINDTDSEQSESNRKSKFGKIHFTPPTNSQPLGWIRQPVGGPVRRTEEGPCLGTVIR